MKDPFGSYQAGEEGDEEEDEEQARRSYNFQLAYFGRNMHFIRNWLRQVIPRTLNFVPRRFLYFWREPRFRMHGCRFETRVSVWSSIYIYIAFWEPHVVCPSCSSKGEYVSPNKPTNKPTNESQTRLVKSTSSASTMSCHLRSWQKTGGEDDRWWILR